MRRLLVLLTGHHSVIVLLTSLLLMDGILVASWFVPALGTFLDDHNVFPLIAITCFIEILLLLSVRVLQETPLALTDELSKHKIRELIDEHKDIRTVSVLSAGLRARADLLRSLLEHPSRLQVEVVACFSEANPDELDRTQFGPAHYEVLTNRLSDDEASRLQIYQSHNSPSVRCILLSTGRGPKYGFLGWYTYDNRNRHIQGRKNLQVFVDSASIFGIEMLSFAALAFKRQANAQESDLIWPLSAPPDDRPPA